MIEEQLWSGIENAIKDVAAGRPVVVVDDATRENEGDLIFAAEAATAELLAFTIRWTSGVICVPLPGSECDRLNLPPMLPTNEDPLRTAFTVSVDARDGVTTGISAADRAHTIRLLADAHNSPDQLRRPGHVFPLRARDGGVLVRPGHTEAAVDLARLAGIRPVAVLAELVNNDGTMQRAADLRRFASDHDLTLVSVADLIRYRVHCDPQLKRVAEARLPTRHGDFRAIGYRDQLDGRDHIAITAGDITRGDDVLVRLHSECLTGDVLGSTRCDCGSQLDSSLQMIAQEGRGVLIYLRGHEGRGIGLLDKLRAYTMQDDGFDTVDANLRLGLPADGRDYRLGARILSELGIRSIRLLTNNPAKADDLASYGISITHRVPLPGTVTRDNVQYLHTKRDRLGHDLPELFFEKDLPDPEVIT